MRVLLLVILLWCSRERPQCSLIRIVDWSLDQRNRRSRASPSGFKAVAIFSLVLCSFAGFRRRARDQSSNRNARPPRAGNYLILFPNETFHRRDPFFSRPRPRRRAGGSVACTNRPIRAAAAHSQPRRDLLGERLRPDLRDAGLRFRSSREACVRSVVKLGVARSLRLAEWLHLGMFMALIAFGLSATLGTIYFGSLLLVAAALFYEHRTAKRLDVAGINRAFFQSNSICQRRLRRAVCWTSGCVCSHGALSPCGSPRPDRSGTSTVQAPRCASRDARLSNGVVNQIRTISSASSASNHSFAQRENIPRRCAAAKGARSLRSNKARSAHRAPCSPPSLRHCPIRRIQFRDRTHRSPRCAAGRMKSG